MVLAFQRAFLVCITASTLSCTPYVDFKLFNNTDARVEIVATWHSGAEETFSVGAGGSKTLPGFARRRWRITTHNWEYQPPVRYPQRFQSRARFRLAYLYLLQLEPDGAIYLLEPHQDPPATKFTSQPEGFPLKPMAAAATQPRLTESAASARNGGLLLSDPRGGALARARRLVADALRDDRSGQRVMPLSRSGAWLSTLASRGRGLR